MKARLKSLNTAPKFMICGAIPQKASYVTDHSVLQSADVSMGTLKSLPPDSSAESINELLAQAKSETQQIYDNSRISLSNIL